MEKDDPFCSFCGKEKADVRKLIAGGGPALRHMSHLRGRATPLVFICNECIELCVQIVAPEPDVGS